MLKSCWHRQFSIWRVGVTDLGVGVFKALEKRDANPCVSLWEGLGLAAVMKYALGVVN